jgi:hypothetical protein
MNEGCKQTTIVICDSLICALAVGTNREIEVTSVVLDLFNFVPSSAPSLIQFHNVTPLPRHLVHHIDTNQVPVSRRAVVTLIPYEHNEVLGFLANLALWQGFLIIVILCFLGNPNQITNFFYCHRALFLPVLVLGLIVSKILSVSSFPTHQAKHTLCNRSGINLIENNQIYSWEMIPA